MAGGAKHAETSFWKLLRHVQAGPNTMGDITQQGMTLTSEMGEANKARKIYVKATPMRAGGFQLDETAEFGPTVERVYWLPWQDFRATCADRRDYEDSEDCKFFMTSALSGCRFTLTPTQVVHVASSAYEGPGGVSQGRSNVEQGLTGPRHAHTRRLSVSGGPHPHDLQYNARRTLVFGIKLHTGAWTYKIFEANPPPGTWSIM